MKEIKIMSLGELKIYWGNLLSYDHSLSDDTMGIFLKDEHVFKPVILMDEKEYLESTKIAYDQYIKDGEGEVAWYDLAEKLCSLTIDYYGVRRENK